MIQNKGSTLFLQPTNWLMFILFYFFKLHGFFFSTIVALNSVLPTSNSNTEFNADFNNLSIEFDADFDIVIFFTSLLGHKRICSMQTYLHWLARSKHLLSSPWYWFSTDPHFCLPLLLRRSGMNLYMVCPRIKC